MKKVAIVTDSNSGITRNQAEQLGIFVVPMPFMIEQDQYLEGINLSQEEFYEKLKQDIPISTSQPAISDVVDLWNDILNHYERVVHIPMSSGLSSSYSTAQMLCEDFDGKVQVVNNQRISVTQRQSVLDAIELAKRDMSASEIKEKLEQVKYESSIYIMVDTLKYLKRGGRITAAAAALGTLLKLKPVLQIQGEKLDAYAKARTVRQAKTIMLDAMKKDIEQRFGGDYHNVHLAIAHTDNEDEALNFKQQVEEAFPGVENYVDHLSLSVSCHIGPGSLALACSKLL